MAHRIIKKLTVPDTYKDHDHHWLQNMARIFGLRFRNRRRTDGSGNTDRDGRYLTGELTRRTIEG